MSVITIKTVDPETTETIVIASGEEGMGVEKVEDKYFFTPDLVLEELLIKAGEEQQDHRGSYHYFDLVGEDDIPIRTQVAVVYHDAGADWTEIFGKYGFEVVDQNGVTVEVDGENPESGSETGSDSMANVAMMN